MERKFPTNNFICSDKSITKKYDLITSTLFGLIWSKCGLSNGFCNVSYQNLSMELGISKKTIQRKIALLIDDNLIIDVSESKFNSPGITRKYICNEKRLMELSEDSKSTVAQENLVSEDLKSMVDTNTEDILSTSEDSLSLTVDSVSTSEDLKSVKIDREIDKELNIEIDIKKKSSKEKFLEEYKKPENWLYYYTPTLDTYYSLDESQRSYVDKQIANYKELNSYYTPENIINIIKDGLQELERHNP